MQDLQTIHVKDCRGGLSHLPQDIGGIHPDRARAAVGQLHHQEDNAVQPLEPPSGKQPAKQRMRRRRHPHIAGQHNTKMLQSVGVTSGTGKSHLLIGLGLAACEQGRRVRYVTTAQLVNDLVEAADDRVLSRVVGRYGRLDLLCLDELGYVKIDPRGAELLFQIITEREERASIAIATNLPFSEWGTVFPDPRLVAAIVDRVTFNAHILETGTQSYRLRTSKTTRARKRAS
jgi:hypothetical protein